MPSKHKFKRTESERSGLLSPTWWRYEVAACGRRAQLGDWVRCFTEVDSEVTCKSCLRVMGR